MGIALSAALVAGIAPVTAIAAETSSPVDAVALQTAAAASSETAAAEKEKAYAAMQEALKNLEAAKAAASSEKLAEIDADIAWFQELYEKMLAYAANYRKPLPDMQANVDAAQAKYDEAHNRVSELQAKLDKKVEVLKALEALGDEELVKTAKQQIKQLHQEIIGPKAQEESYKSDLDQYRRKLEIQKGQVEYYESAADEAKANIDESKAKRDALLGDLEKAQTAYDDACKAYEEAKAAADKATSPEITNPAETIKPSGSTQPAETAQPASSPTTGKDAAPSSAKQTDSSNGKQANTTVGKLANTGDTTPSAIALAGIAAAGLGITATATRRIKNSK